MKKSLTKISDFSLLLYIRKTPLNVKSRVRARRVSNTIMIYTQ